MVRKGVQFQGVAPQRGEDVLVAQQHGDRTHQVLHVAQERAWGVRNTYIQYIYLYIGYHFRRYSVNITYRHLPYYHAVNGI